MSEEAAQATEAEPTNEEIARDPYFDRMFGGVVEDVSVEPKEGEPEKPKDEPKEAKAAEEEETEPEFDDFSDDREWTPERIKNAKAIIRGDKKKVGQLLSRLTAREQKFKGKLEKFRTEKQQNDLVMRSVMTDLQALREGSSEQAIAALGRLSQRDPHSVYEGMSLAMLGKAPQQSKENAVVKALEAKIDQLTAKLEQREHQQTESQQISQAQNQVRAVLQSPEEWPILAAKAKDAPEQIAGEFWQLYVQQSRSAGRWLDVETVADRIERTLRRNSIPSHQVKQNGAAGSGPDREQETRASANPETAQSPPRSLSPSQSAVTGGARRVQSESELQDEFLRNAPPGFFEQFGH